MLLEGFHDVDKGINIEFCSDGGLFNLRHLQVCTKSVLIKLVLCGWLHLRSHTLEDIQLKTTMFMCVSERFSLTVIKKTEVMCHPAPDSRHSDPVVCTNNTPLKSVENFFYLGRTLSRSTTVNEISQRLAKASSSFGRLRQRLWDEQGVVYKVVVLIMLLSSCEMWTA